MCLEFPLYKDREAAGPPWGLHGVYWNLLAQGGDGIKVDNEQDAVETAKGSFERILYYQPSRTFHVGQGSDMISVWRLKSAREPVAASIE